MRTHSNKSLEILKVEIEAEKQSLDIENDELNPQIKEDKIESS